MKKTFFSQSFKSILLVAFLFLASLIKAQTTYDFTTNASLSFGAGGFGIWNTQADITIGGVAYRLTCGGNGSFTNAPNGGVSNSKCLMKDGSGGDQFTLQRADGQPFQFYEIWVKHQSMNSYSQFYTLPPWYTLTATAASNQTVYTNQDMTAMTPGTNWNNYTGSSRTINSGVGGVTVTSVQISFQAIIYFWIDNIIVGPAISNNTAPTVTTASASSIANTSAIMGGNVTSDGGASVTERGIVWSTSSNPTVLDNKVIIGNGVGAFSNTVTGLPSGTTIYYRAYAINSVGTSYGANQSFNSLSALSASQSQSNVVCNGGSNGTATVTVSGGTPGYTYSWSPTGGTSATASGLTAGTYTCTITDNASVSITKTFTITQPTALSVTAASQTNISCFGASNGAASINTPTGGVGGYTYNWTPGNPTGDGTISVTGLTAGIWTCTVTDMNNCASSRSFTLTQPVALTTTAISQTNISCNGGNNGVATVGASGGVAGYTYSWSPSGGTAATASGLSAGTYTVTVTDANACTATRSFTLTQPTLLVATASSQTNVSCNGGSNGAATVTATGGTPSYTYSWSPSGGTSASATGLSAGTYTVTVTDNNNCSTTQNFTITQPSLLAASAGSQTNIACNGASTGSATVTATGGTTGYTYSWSPSGGTAATASGLSAGTYTVTVTDGNSCTATRSFTLTQPTLLVATASSQTNVSCNGGSNGTATVTATGGTPGYTYLWSPSGGTAATASGLTAGTYTVTVTDANACTVTRSFTITQPSAVIATASSQTNIACNGASTGSATVTASGGTTGYTYSWSPSGGTAATASGLSAGTYTVTVTDGNSCTATRSFTLTQPTLLVATASSQTNVSCNGGSNGTATVTATGGTPGYTYLWSPSGGTAATASGLTAGTYTVTVTDANACTATRSFTITQPSAVIATASSQTNIACNGASTGSATVTATGGTTGYTYSWSPSGGTAATASGLSAGTYTVTVTDGNSCTATRSFTLTQPTLLVATASSQTNVSCNGGSNGTATVTATGGTPGYTYSWSPSGGTAATASGLTAGTYTVTVTDANACTATRSFTITQPATLLATASAQTNIACNGGNNGSATVTPSGGTPAYSYSWSPSGGTSATASGLVAGTYTLTLLDSKGCSATRSFTITQPATLVATSSTQTNVLCNGGNNGTATVTASGGTPGYTYSWSPSGGTAATASGLVAGTYTVTVTDANACIATRSFTITQPIPVSTPIVQSPQFFCPGGTLANLNVTIAVNESILWYSVQTGGQSLSTNSLLVSGSNYYVESLNSNGCKSSRVLVSTIGDTVKPVLTIPSDITVYTNSGCNAIGFTLGTASATDNCSIVSPITNNAPAIYPVGITNIVYSVTDGSGNTKTKIQKVTVIDNIIPIITAPANITTTLTAGCTKSGLNLGTPVTSDNCTIASVTNNAPTAFPVGTTSVTWTVTDASGNTATATQTVTVTDAINPTITAPANLTINANASCVAFGVNLGTPVRSDNCTVASVTNNAPAVFPLGITTVTWIVTDGSGNTATATQTVTVVDNTAPTLVAPAALTVNANSGCTATGVNLGTAVKFDNCSIVSTTNNAPTAFPIGTTTVTWTVTDGSGNITTATQLVTVIDNVNPTITAPVAVTANTNAGCTKTGLSLGTPLTADNCSVASVTNNAPTAFPIGTTIVTWTVTDGSGHTSTATQVVTIVDNINPTIIAPIDLTVSTNSGCVATGIALGIPVTTDNCTVASVTNNAPTTFPIGTTTVTWTVTDAAGNIASATQDIHILDTQIPVIYSPNNVTFYVSNGCSVSNVIIGTPITTDNCTIVSVTNDAPLSFPIGSTSVTWTVTDASGNSATSNQIVTVIDTIAPIANLSDVTLSLSTSGFALLSSTAIDLGSTDNCGIESISLSQSIFSCDDLGTKTILVTIIDNYGNSTTESIQVTILESGIDIDFDGIDDACDEFVNTQIVQIPSGFTPDGDHINDTFIIPALDQYTKIELKIFNRYGQSVYESLNYNNDWDGTSSYNSMELPDDTYFYILYTDQELHQGYVYINRVK
jgi:gliding motility-associated-like protein